MACDRLEMESNRFYDKDGRLHVKSSNISKATVNPYYGREIPNSQELGLDPNRIYQLLRHPEELDKGADTFNNIQLLIKHIPVNADEPQKESIAGTVGSDADFNYPYLTNSLAVWDKDAIDLIEKNDVRELSCGYYYDADMTAGEFEGMKYDGIMRNLVGNHVALVAKGRAGSDVLVADEDIFSKKEENAMSKKLKALLTRVLDGKIAQDADPDEVVKSVMDSVEEVKQDEEAEKKAADEEADKKAAEDEEEDKKAADTDPDDKAADTGTVTKEAMDAAIKIAVDQAVTRTKKDAAALAKAREDVAPLVGKVAMDSAEDVYKFALDHAGVDTKGIHPSAYASIVSLVKQGNKPKQKSMATDSAAQTGMLSILPNLKKSMEG